MLESDCIFRLAPLAIKFAMQDVWKNFSPYRVFAVRGRGGVPLYCSVVGACDDYPALVIYVGEDNYKGLLDTTRDTGDMNPAEIYELWMNANYLIVSFEDSAEEDFVFVDEIRKSCKKCRYKLDKNFPYPRIRKVEKRKEPFDEFKASEITYIEECLRAALDVADKLASGKTYIELGFADSFPANRPAPWLQRKKDVFEWGTIVLPDERPMVYEKFSAVNDFDVATVLKHRSISPSAWFVDNTIGYKAICNRVHKAYYFPYYLLVMDCNSGRVFFPYEITSFEGYGRELNQQLLDIMLEHGVPTALYVRDDKGLACYGELAMRLNIPIEKRPVPQMLLNFMDEFYPSLPDSRKNNLDFNDLMDMADAVGNDKCIPLVNRHFMDALQAVEDEINDDLIEYPFVKVLLELQKRFHS